MMKKVILRASQLLLVVSLLRAEPAPDQWQPLFSADLSNAIYPAGVWSVTDGVLTATKDEGIWSKGMYENFELKLEFKTDEGTNSGVFIYGTDVVNWIPNCVEVQIADDHSAEWSKADKTWQCGAIFGRLAANERVVKKPGEWNTMHLQCVGPKIEVTINEKLVTQMDMTKWKEASKNPDGSAIPAWLNRPLAEMATRGHIGFQGKHAGKPIYFRHIMIKKHS